MPTIKTKRSDILRQFEILDMIKKAEGLDLQWLGALIALLWTFGKRITENLQLQKENLWIQDNHLFIRFPFVLKKKVREPYIKYINLKHPAVPYIIKYINTIKEGSLFPKMTRQLALYYLKKVNSQSYLHLFRHSLATEMSERSYTVQELMSWFDWTNAEMAMRYVQRGPALIKRAASRTW